MRLDWWKRFALDLWRDERGEVGTAEPETDTDVDTDEPPTEPEEKPITKADLDKLREEYDQKLEEANGLTQYWYEQASQGGTRDDSSDDSDDDDDDDVDGFLEALQTKGRKAFDDYLKKKGFLSAAEAEQLIDQRAAMLQSNANLAQQYPALRDKDSDLHKETKRQLAALDGTGMRQDKRLPYAVMMAEYTLIKNGKSPNPASEDDRLAAVAGQQGSRGKRGTASGGPAQLNDRQKSWAKSLGMSKEDMADLAKRSQKINAQDRTEE